MEEQRVTVTNLDIKFLNLVWLLIKISFASIPALIIVSTVMWFMAFVGFMAMMALGVAGAM